MKTEFEITDNILIAKFSGEIDHHEAADIRSDIDGTYAAFKKKHIIMDFSGVSFVDSSGIGVIMGRYKKAAENGGITAICGCSEYLRSILYMAGIFTIVKEAKNKEDAVKLVKRLEAAESEEIFQEEKEAE